MRACDWRQRCRSLGRFVGINVSCLLSLLKFRRAWIIAFVNSGQVWREDNHVFISLIPFFHFFLLLLSLHRRTWRVVSCSSPHLGQLLLSRAFRKAIILPTARWWLTHFVINRPIRNELSCITRRTTIQSISNVSTAYLNLPFPFHHAIILSFPMYSCSVADSLEVIGVSS